MIGLSQDIPLNNKRALRRQLTGFQGNNNQFEALTRQAELKADFRVCMVNWYAASKRVEIYSTESKMNARQAHVLNEKLKFGRVIPSDVQLSSALSSESKLRYQNEVKKVQFQKNLCSKFISVLPDQAIEVPLSINFADRFYCFILFTMSRDTGYKPNISAVNRLIYLIKKLSFHLSIDTVRAIKPR